MMLVRLVTGCSWEDAERLCQNRVSDTTVRERRDEWIAAGVFSAIVKEAIAGYDKIIGLDLSDTAVDGSLHKSPAGGEGTGKNPTDRAKLGWKWSVFTDRNGIPIGWAIDGANRHDSVMLIPTLRATLDIGLLTDIETLWLDRGYDSDVTRTASFGTRYRRRGDRQKTQTRSERGHEEPTDGIALARRTHQLMAQQLWSAPAKHRSQDHPPSRSVRSGGCSAAHCQAHRLA